MRTMQWTSSIISGAGRGRVLGVPTFNLDLASVPSDLKEGVYAVRAFLEHSSVGAKNFMATMHYGPRPTFGDSVSCEIHLLEWTGDQGSETREVTVEVVKRLRDIEKFEDAEALKRQMVNDGERAKQILGA